MTTDEYKDYQKSVKTIFESDLKNAQGVPFITVLEATVPTNGGAYVYSRRAGVNSLKFILVDNNRKNNIGLVREVKPPIFGVDIEKYNISAFGGSLYYDVSLDLNLMTTIKQRQLMTLVGEVREEAGYYVNEARVKKVFTKLLGSQSDEVVDCYIVNVTNLVRGQSNKESGEESLETVWLTPEEVLEYGDLTAIAMLHKVAKD